MSVHRVDKGTGVGRFMEEPFGDDGTDGETNLRGGELACVSSTMERAGVELAWDDPSPWVASFGDREPFSCKSSAAPLTRV